MTRCPSCGVPLAVIVELDTDYSKTSEILAEATGADLTNEQLSVQKWKQSTKLEVLSTILVSEAVFVIPVLKHLYDKLVASSNETWKLGEVTYKLSRNDEGAEWLQRWLPISRRRLEVSS